ncbi:MAG TPA: hypothetical protein VFT74_06435 [Isosphaeraceae bacterium]|nr:hypothetical protein [Isosphaeraceae bacterium]
MFTMTHDKTAGFRDSGSAPVAARDASAPPARRPYRRPEVVSLGSLDRLQYGFTGTPDGSMGYEHLE